MTRVVDAKHSGVARHRRRLVLVAARDRLPSLRAPTHGSARQPHTVNTAPRREPLVEVHSDVIHSHMSCTLMSRGYAFEALRKEIMLIRWDTRSASVLPRPWTLDAPGPLPRLPRGSVVRYMVGGRIGLIVRGRNGRFRPRQETA